MKTPKLYILINYKKTNHNNIGFFNKLFGFIPHGQYIYYPYNLAKQRKIYIYLNTHLDEIKNKRKTKYAIQKLLIK